MTETELPVTMRFGDFAVHRRERSLRKYGHRLKLHGQSFEILLVLMDRSGEVVTREELQAAVWKDDTFVDFENGLNAAIKKLRQTLGDSAESPLYIETVPRVGYRFLAPVVVEPTDIPRHATPPASENGHVVLSEEASAGREVADESTSEGVEPRGGKRWRAVVGVGVAVLALGLAGYLQLRRAAAKLTDKDTIVLADFTNSTGDPVFDGTLRQGLAIQLEQSPFLSLVSDERVQRTLRLMGQSADVRLTPELAREVCERTGSAAVLEGSIANLGTQYVLGMRAKACQTGDLLDQEQMQAARKEDVLNTLSQVASKFRARVGESLATVEKHETPLEEATTSSLEALKGYSTALRILESSGAPAATPLFKRATEIDPQFAMAHAVLGRVYDDMGESALSAASTSRAYELREQTSDPEKFFITASYDMQVTGNMEKAEQTCEAWVATYPRVMLPHSFLSGIILPPFAKYESGAAEARRATEVDPDFAVGYLTLAYSYMYLNRFDDAQAALQSASGRKLEMPDYFVVDYDIAFLKDDRAEMERQVSLAQKKSGAEDWITNHQAFVLAYSGHLQEATTMSRRATELALQAAQKERAALYESAQAAREALFGNSTAAKRSATAALRLSKGRDVEYGAAIAFALSGDLSRSVALTNDLQSRFPEDTSVQFSYLPTLSAIVNLERGKPSDAIEDLQKAVPNELGMPGSSFFGFFGALYPVYFRGEAWLAEGKGAEASAEFQKILDRRGIVVSDPVGALAHLGLARGYNLQHDTSRARAAYQDFLSLWKDADSDIPIFKQAKAEFATLQ